MHVDQRRNTPGIDKIVVNTDKERSELLEKLTENDAHRVSPIRRVYIPKKNGKQRALGLPTILD